MATQLKEIKESHTENELIVTDSVDALSGRSVYDIKQELKSLSPMNSPHKAQANDTASRFQSNEEPKKKLEIVDDSSNDAFTFLCSHPEVRSAPLRTSFTDAPKPVSRKRSRPSIMKSSEEKAAAGDDFVSRLPREIREE